MRAFKTRVSFITLKLTFQDKELAKTIKMVLDYQSLLKIRIW